MLQVYEVLSHSPNYLNLAHSDFYLSAAIERKLVEEKFSSNEEVIAETEAFFEAKEKSHYKRSIKKLHDCYNRRIALEGSYVE